MAIQNRITRSGTVKVKDCKANPNNWRLHPRQQYEAMEAAVEEIGWVRGVLINETTGNMVDGHLRLLIAERKGEDEIPADWIKVDEEEERKILISLDPIAALATTNKQRLAMLNVNTRFKSEALQELLNKNIKRAGLDDYQEKIETWDPSEDEAVKLQKKWKTELGQIWQAGPHKIMCADSTDPQAWIQMMRGEKAQLVFTDPPYGVDYTSKKLGKIENDALVDNKLTQMLIGSFTQAIAHTERDAAFYIWHATSTRRDFEYAMDQVGLQEKQYLIWVKDNFTMGWYDYQWQIEPCFYAEKAGEKASYYGDRGQSTVWQLERLGPTTEAALTIANGIKISDGEHTPLVIMMNTNKARLRHFRVDEGKYINIRMPGETDAWQIQRGKTQEYYHPTQKPTELAMKGISNSTLPGQLVVDMYAGGGFTLLAAEKLGRRANVMDLDPKFVAVMLERLTLESDIQPKLINEDKINKSDKQEKINED